VTVLFDGGAFVVNGGVHDLSFIPEPASLMILAGGLSSTAAIRYRRGR
jgi:hypothetical protein